MQEQSRLAAVMILLEYLTDTAVAPLQRQFVELSDPYCSNVRFFQSVISLSFIINKWEMITVYVYCMCYFQFLAALW